MNSNEIHLICHLKLIYNGLVIFGNKYYAIHNVLILKRKEKYPWRAV